MKAFLRKTMVYLLMAITIALSGILFVDSIMCAACYKPYDENGSNIMAEWLERASVYMTPTMEFISCDANSAGTVSFGVYEYALSFRSVNEDLYYCDKFAFRNDKSYGKRGTLSLALGVLDTDKEQKPMIAGNPNIKYSVVVYFIDAFLADKDSFVGDIKREYDGRNVNVSWVGVKTSDKESDLIFGLPSVTESSFRLPQNAEYNGAYGQSIKNALQSLNDKKTVEIMEAMGLFKGFAPDITERTEYISMQDRYHVLAFAAQATLDGIYELANNPDLRIMEIIPHADTEV